MKFEEFKKLDSIGAYADFYSVEEMKELGYIEEDFHEYVPNTCECGSDIMMNGDKTIMTCCNPKCYVKMGYSLNSMLKSFGCKGLGPVSCVSICRKGVREGIFIIPSHIEVLNNFKRFEGLLGAKYDDLVNAVLTIHKTPLKFYEMVQYLGIPGFDTCCVDLFGDVKNFEDLLEKLNEKDIETFFRHRGVNDLKKTFNLYVFLKDIRAFETLYLGNFSKPALKNIPICITGPVKPKGEYMTRQAFIRHCNEVSKVGDSPLFNFIESSAIESVRYVITDAPSPSRKYVRAKNREMLNPGTKIIYTATEFVELIEKEVMKCQESMEKI